VSAPDAAAIHDAFGVDVGDLRPHPGGFEADAFTDGRWFVKLWRYEPDTDASLALTGELAARGLPVPAAVRATDGGYTAEHDGRRYAVFPFVAGRQATSAEIEVQARAMRRVHELDGVALPRTDLYEWCIEVLRDRFDHPWVADRRDELTAAVDRLEAVIERARAVEVPHVVCHHDMLGQNVLIGDDGEVVAIVDWGHAMLAPREHDLFACFDEPDPPAFLRAYGAEGLDLTHLEYALVARGVRDLAARVYNEIDREGVDTWGFQRLRRVDAHLDQASSFS
jgi:Ser/Thr protein kinase RdoA (MazF antagonist)